MAFTFDTISHSFSNADGTAASGNIEFTLTSRMTNGAQTILPTPIHVALDGEGTFTQVLAANTDADTIPQTVTWRVDLRILGVEAETFFITVPVGTASPAYPVVDLGTLMPSA